MQFSHRICAGLLALLLLALPGGCAASGQPEAPAAAPTQTEQTGSPQQAGPATAPAPEPAADEPAADEPAAPTDEPVSEGAPADEPGLEDAPAVEPVEPAAQTEPAAPTAEPAEAAPAPGPAEPEEPAAPAAAAEPVCTFSISCATILNNMDSLDPDKAELVPADGWLLAPAAVAIEPGESVFDVLLRVCRENKIHLEYQDTPGYGSAYVEGIGNLYEFDCGGLSGWMFRVDGAFPNNGCSSCALTGGETVEWVYSCDLGADVGSENPS